MVKRNCKTCGCEFEARQADINRGWARYCSKSCKALSPKNIRHYKAITNAIRFGNHSGFANNGKGDL